MVGIVAEFGQERGSFRAWPYFNMFLRSHVHIGSLARSLKLAPLGSAYSCPKSVPDYFTNTSVNQPIVARSGLGHEPLGFEK